MGGSQYVATATDGSNRVPGIFVGSLVYREAPGWSYMNSGTSAAPRCF